MVAAVMSGDFGGIPSQDWGGFFSGTGTKTTLDAPLRTWYGFDKKKWQSLLAKGSSLKTLESSDLKSDAPKYKARTEGFERIKGAGGHTAVYSRFLFFKRRTGTIEHYRRIGKERTLGSDFLSYDSREKARQDIDRILGLFSKRKEEGSLRRRAPGRGATMLTAPGKSTLTGY